jgi:actin cytoskeleton-regulatory complex protein PAN1
VDKTALEGIPPGERKRQEVAFHFPRHFVPFITCSFNLVLQAIFELINTELAYVRDLQLIVEVCSFECS